MKPHGLPNAERRTNERSHWRTGMLASVLFHLLVFVLWPMHSILLSPFAAQGPKANDPKAAGGSMQALSFLPPPTRPVIPVPVPIAAMVDVQPVEIVDEPPAIDLTDVGTGQGLAGLDGPGRMGGTGAGDGGTSDEGLFRLIPPTPRGMIIPPTNQKLRGTEVEVWVFVDIRGRVVADSTRLRPPTSDSGFNRQLIREAAEWVFRPAMQGGQAVATWFPYKIMM